MRVHTFSIELPPQFKPVRRNEHFVCFTRRHVLRKLEKKNSKLNDRPEGG